MAAPAASLTAARSKPATSSKPATRQAACATADGLAVHKVIGDKVTGDPVAPAAEPKPATKAKTPPDARPAAKVPAGKAAAGTPSADRAEVATPAAATTAPAQSDDAPQTEVPPTEVPPAESPEAEAPEAAASPSVAASPVYAAAGHAPGQPGRPMQQSGRPMPAPRPLAKAENFVKGDHVVYPTHGVGKVERIAVEDIAGHKLELIHITFEENRMTLRVPVAKARTAGLRKLATRSLFDDALAMLKGKARIKRTMWSRRAQEYEAKINSGDPLAIAEVVRDLHRNAGQPDQSFSERQIYEAAMDRLAAELAALDQTDKPTAVVKLAEFLKTV